MIILVSGLMGGVGTMIIGKHGGDVEKLGSILEAFIGKGAFGS